VRGLVAMPPAAAAAFAAIGALRDSFPEWLARGLWDLSTGNYALLGFACGLAFMVAELPNSFIKRQLDVAPGAPPRQRWLRPVCFVLDRSDSTLGVLAVVSAALPVSIATWGWMLLLGPASHAAFSGWLYRVNVKGRAL
jgi:CDP-2,3-bis-(O-geranylgeranyl)-sn-glycerol synthase